MQLNLPEVHGFKVEMGVGPNPKGNGKALNVWLTPATPERREDAPRRPEGDPRAACRSHSTPRA
jgi:hypothetical protein